MRQGKIFARGRVRKHDIRCNIKEHGIETSRTAFQESMLDEDDRVFYEVSLSVEDSFLVTGNFKHYPQTPKVISPADFLKVMMDSKEE